MRRKTDREFVVMCVVFAILILAVFVVTRIVTSIWSCEDFYTPPAIQKRVYVRSTQLEAGVLYKGTDNKTVSQRDHGFVIELVRCDIMNGVLVPASANKYYVGKKSVIPKDNQLVIAVTDTDGRAYLAEYDPFADRTVK